MSILNNNLFINNIRIDCVIFGYKERKIKTLISKLKYKGDFYTLPSGFILHNEDCEDAIKRIIKERTGIDDIHLEQFKVFGKADRKNKEFLDKLIELNYADYRKKNDPVYEWFTNRFVSIGYYAMADLDNVETRLTDFDESLEWYNIDNVPNMIMDYNDIFQTALSALKEDIDIKLNGFKLLPEKFTIMEVQDVYETLLNKEFTSSNFQKKILGMNVLERLEKKYTGAKNKAPYLYKLKSINNEFV